MMRLIGKLREILMGMDPKKPMQSSSVDTAEKASTATLKLVSGIRHRSLPPVKRVSKGHKSLFTRLNCSLFGHQWEFQRKGRDLIDIEDPLMRHGFAMVNQSRFFCHKCGRCEYWEENDNWTEIRYYGIPTKATWYYGFIPGVGQQVVWFDGSGFFYNGMHEKRITHWRRAYPNP